MPRATQSGSAKPVCFLCVCVCYPAPGFSQSQVSSDFKGSQIQAPNYIQTRVGILSLASALGFKQSSLTVPRNIHAGIYSLALLFLSINRMAINKFNEDLQVSSLHIHWRLSRFLLEDAIFGETFHCLFLCAFCKGRALLLSMEPKLFWSLSSPFFIPVQIKI